MYNSAFVDIIRYYCCKIMTEGIVGAQMLKMGHFGLSVSGC